MKDLLALSPNVARNWDTPAEQKWVIVVGHHRIIDHVDKKKTLLLDASRPTIVILAFARTWFTVHFQTSGALRARAHQWRRLQLYVAIQSAAFMVCALTKGHFDHVSAAGQACCQIGKGDRELT